MTASSDFRHVALVTIGTDGDIYPFLSLGVELRARGYDATLVTINGFADRAAKAGIGFHSFLSDAEFDEGLRQAAFWHPIKGPIMLARWGARLFQHQYEQLSAIVTAQPSILITNPGVLPSRVIHDKLGVPLVSILLQPWMIQSVCAPPAMMSGLTLPGWAPRPIGKTYFRLFDLFGALMFGRELHRLRSSLGLSRVRRIFQWWISPQLAIGLFPEWFAKPQPDWLPQINLAGFPLTDGQPNAPVPAETINFCRAGSPPIAFTFGTGMMHAAELFQKTIEACRILKTRAIFLTRFRSQLPDELPSFAHHCEFAPFQSLFPLCATVAHHGGIGTTAKALAAGTPQLILPFAFDQMDNAIRVKRLGAGDWLKPRRRSVSDLVTALQRLLDPQAKAQARAVTALFGERSGIERAADMIDEFRATKHSSLVGFPSPAAIKV